MNFGIKIIAWYDRSLRLWTAIRVDPMTDYQVGNAGYGVSKAEAIADVNYQSQF